MRKRFLLATMVSAFFVAACGNTAVQGAWKATGNAQMQADSRSGIKQASLLMSKELFKKFDRNSDQFIDLGEWTAGGQTKEEFKQLDYAKEGKISISDLMRSKIFKDFGKVAGDASSKLIVALDADKNNQIDRLEFQKGLNEGKVNLKPIDIAMAGFDLADRNFDSQLTASELENLIAFTVAEKLLNAPPPANPPAEPQP